MCLIPCKTNMQTFSGSRSAWRPACYAVARRRCGWTQTRPMRSPTPILVSCLLCIGEHLCGLGPIGQHLLILYLYHRPADPKTGEGWTDHQEACDGSFPRPLPQEHIGTPQGASHGLWWVMSLFLISLKHMTLICFH